MSTPTTILLLCFATPVIWVCADFALWAIERKRAGLRVWR